MFNAQKEESELSWGGLGNLVSTIHMERAGGGGGGLSKTPCIYDIPSNGARGKAQTNIVIKPYCITISRYS